MTEFISGASAFAAAVIALFFLRYWRHTGDRLFLLFSLAFWVFASNRITIAAVDDTSEAAVYLYLVRLLAFGLIIVAIVDKNRQRIVGREARSARRSRG